MLSSETIHSDERTPEKLLEYMDGSRSPFFTFDAKGAQFWNLGSGEVKRHLGSLGISDSSDNYCKELFGLTDQELIHCLLKEEQPFGGSCDVVLDNRNGSPEAVYLWPTVEQAPERMRWHDEFLKNPQHIKWFIMRYGGNFGYYFNKVPTLSKQKFDSVLTNIPNKNNFREASIKFLEQKDEYTIGHMQRVGFLATEIFKILVESKKVPYTNDDVDNFGRDAFAHDIGKINIPGNILWRESRVGDSDLIIIRKNIAERLSAEFAKAVQKGEVPGNKVDEILRSNAKRLEVIMKEIERINKLDELEKMDRIFLDSLGSQGYFSDGVHPKSHLALQEYDARLHIPYGNLLPWEYKLIQYHSISSYKILKEIGAPFPGTALHHINFNAPGSYPCKCDFIELFLTKNIDFPTKEELFQGEIVKVADAFDAMVTERPYSKAKSPFEAIKELKECSGTQFNPIIVEAFFQFFMRDAKTDFQTIQEVMKMGGAKTLKFEDW